MTQRHIGDYCVVQSLGKGSMGETFLTRHRFLGRPYILKVLPSELSSDTQFMKRFEKEVQQLSRLEHPNIAKVHNASSADGICFLVTEAILEAENPAMHLGQYFMKKQFSLPEEEIFAIAVQLASALDFAHEAIPGCGHGSIKPSNIVVKESKEGLKVFLTDYGLFRIIGPLASLCRTYHGAISLLAGMQDLTKVQELHLSFYQNFLFLAPEQKAGGNSQKSDIYAFGILLYYLLTAEFPEGYFELPSRKVPGLKWNWDLLICKTLQTDPLKRPDQLRARIDELLTTNAPASPRAQLQKLKKIAEESKEHTPELVAASMQIRPLLKPKEIARPSFDADPSAIFQNETTVAPYKPELKEEREIEPLLAEMVVIAAGVYLRGSNNGGRDEMPRHEVKLLPFAIDTHPVTNEQFVLFLDAMGGEKDVNNNDIIRLRESRIKRSGGRLNIESGYARHPVVGVTWYGAVAYAKWVGKRLPTEAEWEIASYGGREDVIYPNGNQMERADANFFSSDTTPVMSYPPNGLGLYDMAGNVYEWCQDWYDFHYYDTSIQEPDNPRGPAQGVYRVLRGGCWKSSKEDLRCAHRHRNNPGLMNGAYGFRCAADVMAE
jgi:formylglycine-generating enzyme required for sulfatase activity